METPNTLLLVDDDKDWLLLMQHALVKAGFPVFISLNGADIGQKIEDVHPAVILLDIHMNGISGEDICHELKANKETAGIPLVLLSSNTDIEQVAISCGADGFIPKSASLKEITRRLSPFLAGAA